MLFKLRRISVVPTTTHAAHADTKAQVRVHTHVMHGGGEEGLHTGGGAASLQGGLTEQSRHDACVRPSRSGSRYQTHCKNLNLTENICLNALFLVNLNLIALKIGLINFCSDNFHLK